MAGGYLLLNKIKKGMENYLGRIRHIENVFKQKETIQKLLK